MEASPVLNGILLGWFLALWLCARLIDVNVPMTSISASGLSNSVGRTGSYCPHSLSTDGYWRKSSHEHNSGFPRNTRYSVEECRRTAFLLREKIDVVLANSRDITTVVEWFMEQIRMDHLIADVLSCEHVWLTIYGAFLAGAIAQLLIFDPFITMKNAPTKYVTEMKRAEKTYVHEVMRKFVVEKFLVLAYVVVRNRDGDHLTTARRPFLDRWSYRVTDATVFAIWFTLVWSVSSLTISINQRFEMITRFVSVAKTVGDGEISEELSKSSKQEEINDEQSEYNVHLLMKRLILVLMACFFTATAMTSFGLTSFKVMHILYALMFTVEGLEVLVRSVYVTYRVAWWHVVPNVALRNSEAFRKRCHRARRIADVLFSSLSVVQYLLYLIVGTVINGKLIPLVFVSQLTHHLHRSFGILFGHFSGHDISAYII